jgi:hypothetical protein
MEKTGLLVPAIAGCCAIWQFCNLFQLDICCSKITKDQEFNGAILQFYQRLLFAWWWIFFIGVYTYIITLFPDQGKKLKTFTILKLIKAINKSDGPHIQIQITKRKKKMKNLLSLIKLGQLPCYDKVKVIKILHK